LHAILKHLPDKTVQLPILLGPLKGMRMMLNLKWERQFLYGSYENDVVKAVFSILKKGAVVYDIGAQVGYFSLLFSLLAGVEGTVAAFEPNPLIFQRLKENIGLNNKQTQIKLFQLALYDREDIMEFFVGGSTSTGRLCRIPPDVLRSELIQVSVTTIDSLIKKGELIPDLMKIDVEYVEDKVLYGAVNVLKNHRPMVLCEVHAIDTGLNCYELLKSMHYTIKHLESGNIWESKNKVQKGHILAVYESGNF
jgi:FkbM family methyltransferase